MQKKQDPPPGTNRVKGSPKDEKKFGHMVWFMGRKPYLGIMCHMTGLGQ